MLSGPYDKDREGGAGYGQDVSSLDRGSEFTDADQVADGVSACGVYGENAGVMGESAGYDRQLAFGSPGLEELGLASGIQLDIPWCP